MLSRTSQKQGKQLHQSGINATQVVCSVQKQAWLVPLAARLSGFVPCLVRHGARDQTLPYRQASSPPLSYIHPQPSFLSHNLASKSFRGQTACWNLTIIPLPEHASLQKVNENSSTQGPSHSGAPPIQVPFTPGLLRSLLGAPIPQQSWEPWVQSQLNPGKGQIKGPDWLWPEYKDPLVIWSP